MPQTERKTYLAGIASPEDVKALPARELPALCAEIRAAILRHSAAIGGHVGSNLGVVELTVALHRVFDSPRDKIIFDVSHQTYAHKMLTGRVEAYLDPARYQEVSGFSCPAESEHDLFAMGHTSTSVSLACGMAKARDLAGERHDVVAVIGDGSLSGGLAFEGLDSLAELGTGVIVIVNDNDWSIAENHGGVYRCLKRLRESGGTAPDNIFRALGLDYRYVDDGNDVNVLVRELARLRGIDHPVVLHVRTIKGDGYEPALEDAEGWHHVGPFDLGTGAGGARTSCGSDERPSYAYLTARMLLRRMAEDPGTVGISAATPYVMGFLPPERTQAGEQFVDVGIAEEHAVTYATGLAKAGAHPVLGVYGVFLQRAYDELWHDLCLNAAPATLLVYGCSVFGTNDVTHLGLFDIPMLSSLPGLTYLAPAYREEFEEMLSWALGYEGGPVAIRVPGAGVSARPDLQARFRAQASSQAGDAAEPDALAAPRYRTVRTGSRVCIIALGDFFELGEQVADELERAHGIAATLVNPRCVMPLDEASLARIAASHELVVTLEDGVLEGGWGEKVARCLGDSPARVRCYGIRKGYPDRFDPHELLAENGITVTGMAEDIARDIA